MGLKERFSGAWKALVTQPPRPDQYRRFIGANVAGIHVTDEIAFQSATVWACMDVIASAIASSNWNVQEWLAADKQAFLYNDPLQSVLNTRMNPEMTAKSGKYAMTLSAVAFGNGYGEIVRDLTNRPVQIWPICRDRVTPVRAADDGRLLYRVYNQGYEPSYLEQADVFHIRGPGLTGLLGDDTISKAVKSIALSVAQQRFAETYFANNAQLGLVVTAQGALDDEQFERLKGQLEEKHGGVGKAFRSLILESVQSVENSPIKALDAQLIEARYQQVEEICRWFRVPPHKVQHLLRSTFNNIEQLGMEFSRDTLRPWKVEIEQEAEYKLFSARGKVRFVNVDTTWAQQGDFKSRMEGYQIGRAMGVYSANDVLKKEGENTIGKEGDIRIVNGAFIPLEHVGENYRNTGTPSEPEAPADPTVEKPDPNEPAPKPIAPSKAAKPTRAVMASWLATIYARVGNRFQNRRADLERGARSRDEARDTARGDAYAYAIEQLAEFAEIVGKYDEEQRDYLVGALAVINGAQPRAVAAGIFETTQEQA